MPEHKNRIVFLSELSLELHLHFISISFQRLSDDILCNTIMTNYTTHSDILEQVCPLMGHFWLQKGKLEASKQQSTNLWMVHPLFIHSTIIRHNFCTFSLPKRKWLWTLLGYDNDDFKWIWFLFMVLCDMNDFPELSRQGWHLFLTVPRDHPQPMFGKLWGLPHSPTEAD